MEYEWDSAKKAQNLAKHGIDFAAACYVFRDDLRLEVIDGRHNPVRFRALGSVDGTLLIVVYEERKDKLRIISARLAEGREKDAYRKRSHRF